MTFNPNIALVNYEDRKTLASSVAQLVAADLQSTIDSYGRASFAASGGSTLEGMYQALSTMEIEWRSVDVAIVDERWVPFDHARSNERMICETLMQNRAATASFTGMYADTNTPQLGCKTVEGWYQHLVHPFSHILLGMGEDGHTASLFPDAIGLEEALSPANTSICAPIEARKSDTTGSETLRMTITLSAIRSARTVSLLITGKNKLDVLMDALMVDPDLPVARVINALERPLNVFWSP